MPRYITIMLKSGRYLALLVACLLAAGISSCLDPILVSGHARLDRSDPVSGSALASMPQTIALSFTEPVDPSRTRITLFDPASLAVPITAVNHSPDRHQVDLSPDSPGAGPGVYVLTWSVTSTSDGHDSSGTILFSVGTGRAPVLVATDNDVRSPAWQIGFRAIWLAGLGLIPAIGFTTIRRRMAILFGAGLAGVVASLAAPAVSFEFDSLTRSGRFQIAAGAATLGAAILAAIVSSGRVRVLFLVPWLAAIALLAASGHAAGVANSEFAIIVATVHTAVTLGWFGWVLHTTMRVETTSLERLSRVATVGLLLVIATGTVNAALHLPDGDSVSGSLYGRSLALKLGIVILVLAIAGTNRWVVRPWLRDRGMVDRQSRLLIAAEAIALALAILLGAVLSNTAPPPDQGVVQVAAPIQRYSESAATGDLTVRLSGVLTGTVDDYFQLNIIAPDGTPPSDIQRVIVETSAVLAGGGYISERFDAEPETGGLGAFRFDALRLGVAAVWTVETTIRRSGVSDVALTFVVDTSALTAPAPRVVEREWSLPVVPPSAWALLAFALLVGVVGLFVLIRQRNVAPLSGALILIALAMITTGFTVQAYQRTAPETAGHDLATPPDRDLVAAAANYELLCLACHGPGGVGLDAIDPNHQHGGGTNLVDALTRTRSAGDLFTLISTGVPGTDMPAYDLALTDEERWDLVAYLRQLPGDAEAPGS